MKVFTRERKSVKARQNVCVIERKTGGKVKLQGAAVVKLGEFKYLGSTIQSNLGASDGMQTRGVCESEWQG